MSLKTCLVHKITYNDRLDPHCPQCTLAGNLDAEQADAEPGKFGAPKED